MNNVNAGEDNVSTPAEITRFDAEFLVTVAARELAGKRRVFAGVGLPTLAVDLARRRFEPQLEMIYESGVAGAHPQGLAEGIADSVLVSGAESVLTMEALFGYVLQRGHVDVGFLGAAQVDRWGNLNTSFIGDPKKPKVRLPGSGGAADIIASAGEAIVIMRRHDLSALPEAVDFVTSPSPVRAREKDPNVHVSGHGVSTVITPLGVLRRPDRFGELELAEVFPGVEVADVQEATGWDLKISDDLVTTAQPSQEDVTILQQDIDPDRFYLR